MSDADTFWKKCSSCKKEIAFESLYYLCSVSTCCNKRTGVRFCSVGCWDAHLGFANHRSAWAEEVRAPSLNEFLMESKQEPNTAPTISDHVPKRTIVPTPATTVSNSSTRPATPNPQQPLETLVVVSKVKAFIREQSDFNTSQCCIDALTKKVMEECRKAINQARTDGRKTVMGRDVR